MSISFEEFVSGRGGRRGRQTNEFLLKVYASMETHVPVEATLTLEGHPYRRLEGAIAALQNYAKTQDKIIVRGKVNDIVYLCLGNDKSEFRNQG